MKRYYVGPIDNCGSVSPPPPRDRTWGVFDRQSGTCVADCHSRILARAEAARLNDSSSVNPKGTSP